MVVGRRAGGPICPSCLAGCGPSPPPVPVCAPAGAVHALWVYQGLASRLVLAAKNRGRVDVAAQLGRLLAPPARSALVAPVPARPARAGVDGPAPAGPVRAASTGWWQPEDAVEVAAAPDCPVVTWVPAAPGSRRRRGYDQGRLLARALAVELGGRARPLLLRGPGRAQTGRNRAQRLAGPALRAPLTPRGDPGHPVVLVDDVVTTGASMAAAVGALRLAGHRRVVAVAVARTP